MVRTSPTTLPGNKTRELTPADLLPLLLREREVEMAAIAVSASTGVMNSLLSKLSILLSDQYKQLKGVRKDI